MQEITLKNALRRVASRQLRMIISYHLYDRFKRFLAPNIVGGEAARENAATLRMYKNIFQTLVEDAKNIFILEAAKFFDKQNSALSFKFLINLAEEKRVINKKDAIALIGAIKKEKQLIKDFKTWRDKIIAHDDWRKEGIPTISSGDIDRMFGLCKFVLNNISSKSDNSIYSFAHIGKDCEREVKLLIIALKEHEKDRLAKIQRKYNREIRKLNRATT